MPHGVDFQEIPVFDLLGHQPLSRHVGLKSYVYSGYSLGRVHRHLYYGIELVTGGHCTQYINGSACDCIPGAVCLLSPSYFTKAFKARFGKAPTAYRFLDK